jgi:hypothetical protein
LERKQTDHKDVRGAFEGTRQRCQKQDTHALRRRHPHSLTRLVKHLIASIEDEVLQIGKAKVPVADESVDTTGCTDNDVSERVLIGKKVDVRLDRCPTNVCLEASGECDVIALLVFDSGTAVIGVEEGVLSSVQTADRVNCIPPLLSMLEVDWRSGLQSWSLGLLFVLALLAAMSQTRIPPMYWSFEAEGRRNIEQHRTQSWTWRC